MPARGARRQALERKRAARFVLADCPHSRHATVSELLYGLVATEGHLRSCGAVFSPGLRPNRVAIHAVSIAQAVLQTLSMLAYALGWPPTVYGHNCTDQVLD
jgi:hypothetical protein